MKFQPLGDKVIVGPAEKKTVTDGGILLPERHHNMQSYQIATVLAVGPGTQTNTGKLIPMDVSVGDRVVFNEFGGVIVREQGEEFTILKRAEIAAVVTE